MTNIEIEKIIIQQNRWLEKVEFQSFDWWDIWGEGYGKIAKKIYMKNQLAGLLPVGSVIFLDTVYPGFRKYFVTPRSFPICHAHAALAYLNMWEYSNDGKYLQKAMNLSDELLQLASPKIKNLGWGMKHEWMTVQGLIPKDTPCNTQTAYAYALFSRLHDLTKDSKYVEYLRSISEHVMYDFNETISGDIISCSYSTMDNRRVVNANSYRMYMLIDAGVRLKQDRYLQKGLATYRYVKKMQAKDGSWPYSEDQDFIDNYHTCFVLKNLLRSRAVLAKNYEDIDNVIERGWSYFKKNLLDTRGMAIPFSKDPGRFVNYKYDSYDLAETISLSQDLNVDKNGIDTLIHFAKHRFQSNLGWFKFRIFKYPVHHIPYLRYANTAMFLALTKVLLYRKIHNGQ